jgi:hypothetical protein
MPRVFEKDILKRVNERLRRKRQVLRRARPDRQSDLRRFYLFDLDKRAVLAIHLDLGELAGRLGVLNAADTNNRAPTSEIMWVRVPDDIRWRGAWVSADEGVTFERDRVIIYAVPDEQRFRAVAWLLAKLLLVDPPEPKE